MFILGGIFVQFHNEGEYFKIIRRVKEWSKGKKNHDGVECC